MKGNVNYHSKVSKYICLALLIITLASNVSCTLKFAKPPKQHTKFTGEVERHLSEMDDEFNSDSETFLSVLKPSNNHLNLVKTEYKRQKYIQYSNLWVTKLQAKLDHMKFLVFKRIQRLSINLNHTLKKRGFSPIVKYKSLKESMRNPLFNPYLAMVSNPVSLNRLMATKTPEQAQQQISMTRNMASIYGDAMAAMASGVYGETDPNNTVLP